MMAVTRNSGTNATCSESSCRKNRNQIAMKLSASWISTSSEIGKQGQTTPFTFTMRIRNRIMFFSNYYLVGCFLKELPDAQKALKFDVKTRLSWRKDIVQIWGTKR